MGRTTNLELARLKLDSLMVEHQGQLTLLIINEYLKVVSVEFNLDLTKIEELKSFKYSREVEHQNPNQPVVIDKDKLPEGVSEHIRTNITEADFFALQERCDNLEAVISRLAVNTGNANWLREYGIERWTPEKKHMSKKYA